MIAKGLATHRTVYWRERTVKNNKERTIKKNNKGHPEIGTLKLELGWFVTMQLLGVVYSWEFFEKYSLAFFRSNEGLTVIGKGMLGFACCYFPDDQSEERLSDCAVIAEE